MIKFVDLLKTLTCEQYIVVNKQVANTTFSLAFFGTVDNVRKEHTYDNYKVKTIDVFRNALHIVIEE